MLEVRADRSLGDATCSNDLTIGQHRLEPENLLAHRSVLARQIADTVGRDRPTHTRNRLTPRVVAHHEAMRSCLQVEIAEHHAGLDPSHPVLVAYREDAAHRPD